MSAERDIGQRNQGVKRTYRRLNGQINIAFLVFAFLVATVVHETARHIQSIGTTPALSIGVVGSRAPSSQGGPDGWRDAPGGGAMLLT